MSRSVILSNGQMMVGLDSQGLVHVFYYPYVGQENLTSMRGLHHKIGIWIDNNFSWLNNADWIITTNFENNALISEISARSDSLQVLLNFNDFVDCEHNAFVRRIKVTNLSEEDRQIRIFMHQVFQISAEGMQDTAVYMPDLNYLYDFRGRVALLIYAQSSNGKQMDQYAVGNYYNNQTSGTFIDAQDGELSNNAVEHGSVDSVMRLSLNIKAKSSKKIDYWIIAASSQYECETIHTSIYLPQSAISAREKATREYWHNWLSTAKPKLLNINKSYLEMTTKSLMIIKAHCDKRGGILASGDSNILNYGKDYYEYCWPRDGSYAMWPLIRMGYKEEPKKFFEFCRDTLHPRGYMLHKYLPDKSMGSTWHPRIRNGKRELAIQEDETAIVVCMIGEYLDYSNDTDFVQSLYSTFIQPTCNFMSNYIDENTNLPHASYDLWEEKFSTSTYTSIVVEHALRRGARLAEMYEYPDDAVNWLKVADKIKNSFSLLFDEERQSYRKGFYLRPDGSLDFDNIIDSSSLYGVLMFGDTKALSTAITKTAAAVETYLTNLGPIGGTVRYEDDWYMRSNKNDPPNPWFVCSLWLAQYYILTYRSDKAVSILEWTKKLALPSGMLSEQLNPLDGRTVGVVPLVWSHAEYINTVLDVSSM